MIEQVKFIYELFLQNIGNKIKLNEDIFTIVSVADCAVDFMGDVSFIVNLNDGYLPIAIFIDYKTSIIYDIMICLVGHSKYCFRKFSEKYETIQSLFIKE